MQTFRTILKNNRIRLILTAVGISAIVLYRLLHLFPGAERWVYLHIVHPYHGFAAGVCDHFDFSAAEVLIIFFAAALIVFTIGTLVYIIYKKRFLQPCISLIITYIMLFCMIYGGFCLLWGVYYSAPDAEEVFGISTDGVEHEDLIAVDKYFAGIAEEYSVLVSRDADNHYLYERDKVFDHALTLYDNVSIEYPGLEAKAHRPKSFVFSQIMSYMDFSGFFFPLTAEANINTDEPGSLIPSCIAHEMAHQRGIAAEDECNFTGILACLEDGDPDYVYSGSLLALIHLQNALYRSGDEEAWQEIRDTYTDEIVTDLTDNSTYWKKYRKSAAYKASSSTYDSFLKSYDQTMGRETYGACVDLLVEYYKEEARSAAAE